MSILSIVFQLEYKKRCQYKDASWNLGRHVPCREAINGNSGFRETMLQFYKVCSGKIKVILPAWVRILVKNRFVSDKSFTTSVCTKWTTNKKEYSEWSLSEGCFLVLHQTIVCNHLKQECFLNIWHHKQVVGCCWQMFHELWCIKYLYFLL